MRAERIYDNRWLRVVVNTMETPEKGGDGLFRPKTEEDAIRIKIDKDNDTLYFRLDENRIIESEEVRPGVVLDFDEQRSLMKSSVNSFVASNMDFQRIGFRLAWKTDNEPTAHRLLLIRSRTTSHGDPSSGFRWQASRWRSSSAFCSLLRPIASGSVGDGVPNVPDELDAIGNAQVQYVRFECTRHAATLPCLPNTLQSQDSNVGIEGRICDSVSKKVGILRLDAEQTLPLRLVLMRFHFPIPVQVWEIL